MEDSAMGYSAGYSLAMEPDEQRAPMNIHEQSFEFRTGYAAGYKEGLIALYIQSTAPRPDMPMVTLFLNQDYDR